MSKFLAGFFCATLLWAGVTFAYVSGVFDAWITDENDGAPDATVSTVNSEQVEEVAPVKSRARRGGRNSSAGSGEAPAPSGNATIGDSIREDEPRLVDLGSSEGEAQLPSSAIDSTFDSAMPRIRRCLILAAGDDPVTGRITFILRIGGNGGVEAAQVTGPAAITRSEAGECLTGVARGLHFPSFDGPTMTARYPITLE